MDTAWIKVVVLTLTECVAPEGKTVCEESVTQYNFVDQAECETVLEHMVEYRARRDNVIVNRSESHCKVSAKFGQVYDSDAEVDKVLSTAGSQTVASNAVKTGQKDFQQEAHASRLETTPECDDQQTVRPCKIGEIILEPSVVAEPELWTREN